MTKPSQDTSREDPTPTLTKRDTDWSREYLIRKLEHCVASPSTRIGTARVGGDECLMIDGQSHSLEHAEAYVQLLIDHARHALWKASEIADQLTSRGVKQTETSRQLHAVSALLDEIKGDIR